MNSALVTKLRPLLPLLADIVVPVVLYFALKQAGLNDFWALTIAGVATGAATAVNTVRRKRLDWIGLLVILEIALTIALIFVTDDPRIVAIKPAFYTVLTGAFLGVTCFVGRPIVYQAAAPMAIKGDPKRAIAYDRAWDESAEFRRRQRTMTGAFALFLIAESVLRVVIVYQYTIEEIEKSFLLSQLPGIVLLVFVLGYFRLQVPALRRIVDSYETPDDEPSNGGDVPATGRR